MPEIDGNTDTKPTMPDLLSDNPDDLRGFIRERYTLVAERGHQLIPDDGGACCAPADEACCSPNAERLYSSEEIGSVPDAAAAAAAGCGNPTAIGELKAGETGLDLGSGGGIDCFLAAKQVGPTGHVIGIDMTPAMIDLARKNAVTVGADNVVFKLSTIESLPEPDNTVDAIISNCVINLAADKRIVFAEAYRVLNEGGRLYVSDIVITEELPEEVQADVNGWTGCVAGAQLQDVYLAQMADAGFTDIEVVTSVPTLSAGDEPWTESVRSISVRAVKTA
ncbi:MAG: arsenite methyltransferase [Dehalococcoidia bacterium]|jgi:SAM-dependent methyltransferase|nr:arsenite methyltransferase [Dehalococcoidia bacterium]